MVGSRGESRAKSGLAHFMEHITFKGTRDMPTTREVSDAIEGVGGSSNAATDRESTVYWTRLPVREAELGVHVGVVDLRSAGRRRLEEGDDRRDGLRREVLAERLGQGVVGLVVPNRLLAGDVVAIPEGQDLFVAVALAAEVRQVAGREHRMVGDALGGLGRVVVLPLRHGHADLPAGVLRLVRLGSLALHGVFDQGGVEPIATLAHEAARCGK